MAERLIYLPLGGAGEIGDGRDMRDAGRGAQEVMR